MPSSAESGDRTQREHKSDGIKGHCFIFCSSQTAKKISLAGSFGFPGLPFFAPALLSCLWAVSPHRRQHIQAASSEQPEG